MPADPPGRLAGEDPVAAQAAGTHSFNEATLRQTLGAIAQRSRATAQDIERALEEGFRQGVAQAMSDGILTRQEEERLRTFRDNLNQSQGEIRRWWGSNDGAGSFSKYG